MFPYNFGKNKTKVVELIQTLLDINGEYSEHRELDNLSRVVKES